ncbi:MAG: DUF4145 domain-containing protein, partial [Nitrososphaera sp.]|nr:DUF4145 domain-containing protein [Nitrososphaera sp.]
GQTRGLPVRELALTGSAHTAITLRRLRTQTTVRAVTSLRGIWNLEMCSSVTVCPNNECKEYTIEAELYKITKTRLPTGHSVERIGKPLIRWQLRPQSKAKQFPSYIPQQILDDYREACLIKDLSPKASATLSRRALQGIIRDFWGIKKDRLIDEIHELKGKVDQVTWEAIDAVRSIGNIGAHMEKDINLIIDVEPEEAELLIGLIEILLKDWYIARYERQQHLQSIVSVAQAKQHAKKESES